MSAMHNVESVCCNTAQVTYRPDFQKFVSLCNQADTHADQCESLT